MLGRVNEAMVQYGLAIAAKPDDAEPYFNLGNAFDAIGREADAADAHRKALAIMRLGFSELAKFLESHRATVENGFHQVDSRPSTYEFNRLYSPHEAFFTSHPHRRAPSFRPFICLIGYRGNSQCNAFGINLPSSAGSEGRAAPPFTERMA
jgi:tetratricopeptide (TPR) repeat protein